MLIFIKRRSPEDIKMKKDSLIIVYHAPSCPVIYLIRNVLHLFRGNWSNKMEIASWKDGHRYRDKGKTPWLLLPTVSLE